MRNGDSKNSVIMKSCTAWNWKRTLWYTARSYRIEAILGEGGMGKVYWARATRPGCSQFAGSASQIGTTLRLTPRATMCLDRIRSDRRQRIPRGFPPLEADHFGNRRRHLEWQFNDFAHEKCPRARVRVKSARRLDLGVAGLRFVCLFKHSEIWCDPATSGHPA
jgi:hypothetical protein